ncbi:MAG: tRNA threonylcarbamoyladenosine dehydratase [Erysipelotrichaceae bacterium]|nr:tRNA threonylcarbamoyladenosine dehydratase [Erysipelotrichaceae bacterium]
MLNQFSRTELLYGKGAMDKLYDTKVAIFGIGGVGGYVVEALARSGIGHFVLVDNDKVSLTNLNRQIIATMDTVGKYKVDVMKDRILSINPQADIEVRQRFFLPENKDEFDFASYDYVVDAVDTVTAKIAIITQAKVNNIPIISSMGAGNKIDPTAFEIADIYDTSIDPLARVMRHELRKRYIADLKVVYSKEKPIIPIDNNEVNSENDKRRSTPGSTAFVPSVAGLIIASEVIKDLTAI